MPLRPGITVEYAFRPLDAAQARSVASWAPSATVADGVVVVSFGDSYCPACGHDASPPSWSPQSIEHGALGLAPATGRTGEQIVVRCACRERHPGRPLTEPFGCGRAWTVLFDWDVTPTVGPVTAGPLPSAADLGFAARLAELEASELTRVRAQAQGWSTVLAGLTGLILAGQIFAARGLADTIAGPWRDVIGVLLTVALLAAAASSVFAGLAAYGRPGNFQLSGTAAAGGQDARLNAEVASQLAAITPNLSRAAVLAGVAFGLAALVGAASWWAPRTHPAEPVVCVAGPHGQVTRLAGLPAVRAGALAVVGCRR